jgi:phage terminase small subunit
MDWGERWGRSKESSHRCLSAASIAALRSLWDEEGHPDWLQRYAFSLWCRHVEDLGELQSIPNGSSHFEAAAWQRALRGDREIVPYVLEKLSDDPWWLHVVPPIWCQEFVPTIDAALTALAADSGPQATLWSNTYYRLSLLLRDIPTEAAERLLVKHWGDLGRVHFFIQAALYHGTETCRTHAADSLRMIGPGREPFEHIGSFFGFFTQGLMDRLTVRHLETLKPYLDWLDDFCISEMLEFCQRYDQWEWALQHLRPECRRRGKTEMTDPSGQLPYIVSITRRWFPSDEELLADLDKIEKGDPRHFDGSVLVWWDRFIQRKDSSRRPPEILEQWLRRSPSLTRFKVAAYALRDRGTRQDLAMLRNCNFDSKPTEVEPILTDVEFAVMRRSLDYL